MLKKLGDQSVLFENPISIISTASIAGPKEGEGPLKDYFDVVLENNLYGEETWEKAESRIAKEGLELAVKKSSLEMEDIDYIITGDLLNQNIGATFGVLDFKRPHFGVYSACSSMSEAMTIGAMIIDGGFAENILAGVSSHFNTAERQFRFPTEFGTQRPLTSTWTVTGEGAVVISKNYSGPYITIATTGKIVDFGIKDSNNMGAAMAPSAVDTLIAHFSDTKRTPDYYDLIITGDLGYIGKDIVLELMSEKGYNLENNYSDCGIEIFDREIQDTHSGGSGCACSAITFAGYLYSKLKNKQINKLLFIPTGALLSPISTKQGKSIPGIAHAIAIENELFENK